MTDIYRIRRKGFAGDKTTVGTKSVAIQVAAYVRRHNRWADKYRPMSRRMVVTIERATSVQFTDVTAEFIGAEDGGSQ